MSKENGGPRFERGTRTRGNSVDEVGTVIIRFHLLRGSAYAKGNISRSISVRSAKISEVYAAVEEALFGATPAGRQSKE